MKKFFLSGCIVATVAVALAATHNDNKNTERQVNGYGIYCQDNYADTVPPRDTNPKPDTPPRLRF